MKQRTVLVVMSRTRTHNTRSRKRQKTNPPSGDSNIPGEQPDAIVEEATGIDPVPEQPNPEPESSSDSASGGRSAPHDERHRTRSWRTHRVLYDVHGGDWISPYD